MKTEVSEFDDGSRTIYTYDDDGNQLRTTDYDPEGSMTCDIHYENNESGDVTCWKVYRNGSSEVFRRFEVDYDSDGFESEVREYGEGGALLTRETPAYDESGRRTGSKTFDAEGNLLLEESS
jgi:antitoxin component YwqK of YwqJK toxin-antitoxin module